MEDRARTTRDRLYAATSGTAGASCSSTRAAWSDARATPIEEKVQDQARLAIEEADVIVFVVDAAAGETPADEEAARDAAHGARRR